MEPITIIFLEIFGNQFEVLRYNIGFSQIHNATTGRPSGEPIGDILQLEIISNGENDFIEWMTESVKQNDGELCFYSGGQLLKTIKFKKAYLVNYQQNIGNITDAAGNQQRVITEDLAISYKDLDFGDITFEKES